MVVLKATMSGSWLAGFGFLSALLKAHVKVHKSSVGHGPTRSRVQEKADS